MSIFHLLHDWHMLHEFGLGAGFSAGLVLGIEIQEFPVIRAVRGLAIHDGDFTISGSQLIFTAQEVGISRPGSAALFEHVKVEHSLSLPFLLICVVACTLIGYWLASAGAKKITTSRPILGDGVDQSKRN